MPTAVEMHADCARCVGLCCVAPAFDRSDEFAIDKPGGEPCPHLDAAYRCRIHAQREELGFKGCISHDCLGAGQRVTQEVFAGQSWRDDPSMLPAMIGAFATMREVHELLAMLDVAGGAPLLPIERRTFDQLSDALTPSEGWTIESLDAFERQGTSGRVRQFLRTLKHHFSDSRQAITS